VAGGPVAVDQRLTVFEDGVVEFDERHRSRDPLRSQLRSLELEELRTALDELPAERWSRFVSLTAARKLLWPPFGFPKPPSGTRRQVNRGRRGIIERELNEPDVAGVFDRLDEVRLRVLRDHPR